MVLSRTTLFSSTLNLGFRGLSVLAKLFLVIFLGKYFRLEDLGLYHLFAVSQALFLFFIGFEFHAFASRFYVEKDSGIVREKFSSQLALHLLSYLVLLPILWGFFQLDFLPVHYLLWFLGILVFEHLSAECGRMLASRKFSGWFNFLFFLRSGFWIYVFMAWDLWVAPLGLEALFLFWFLGVLISFLVALFVLWIHGLSPSFGFSIDWKWLRSGLAAARPFFMLAIFLRLIDYLDRYFVEYFHGKAELGIYSFFSGIANVPNTLVTSALTIQFIPLFVAAASSGDLALKKKHLKEYALLIALLLALFGGLILLLIDPLLQFVGKEALTMQKEVLYLKLGAAVFFCFTTIPQLLLYSENRDWILMWTGFWSLVINVFLNILLVPEFGIMGAAWASLATWLGMFIMRGSMVLGQRTKGS